MILKEYPIDLTNSLSDIGSLINRTLNEGLTNITETIWVQCNL